MRQDTFTTLYQARDHVANDAMRIKINDWSNIRAKMVILEASEALRDLLLDEMEALFAEWPKEPEATQEEITSQR